MEIRYSVIIPVYNRPNEVDELLQSLAKQTYRNFEVVVVEDGSSVPCRSVVEKYAGALDLHYLEKKNSGPGLTRNFGAEHSRGEYLIFLDSDCVLPETYLQAVEKAVTSEHADAFGGPDRAHASFTPTQKAINYAMTSFLTTGGIRGGMRKLDKFYPRSFNMGIKADVFRTVGGFSDMRFGEDIDFSIRIKKTGCRVLLFPEAWVWHKRRTDLKKFFKQVYNSGIARIELSKRHPGSLKVIHLLPTAFTVAVCLLLICLFVCLFIVAGNLLSIGLAEGGTSVAVQLNEVRYSLWGMLLVLSPLALFSILILGDAWLRNRSFKVGLLAVPASFVQLTGYGSGFISAWWKRCVLREQAFSAFEKTFYK